jgi:hypothetical protein
MIRSYTITLDRPPNVTDAEMREYIRDSVGSMIGCKMPEEPIWALDRDSIKVKNGPKDGK